jgi:hypothetical protein
VAERAAYLLTCKQLSRGNVHAPRFIIRGAPIAEKWLDKSSISVYQSSHRLELCWGADFTGVIASAIMGPFETAPQHRHWTSLRQWRMVVMSGRFCWSPPVSATSRS